MLSFISTIFLSFLSLTPINYGLYTFSRRSLLLSSLSTKSFNDNLSNNKFDKIKKIAKIAKGEKNNIIYPDNIINTEENEKINALINIIKNNIYFSGPLTDESIFAITSPKVGNNDPPGLLICKLISVLSLYCIATN